MSKMVEQNTLKRRGVGLRACNPERACPGFTLFTPRFEQNRTVYLIDLQGEVVHTWHLPYAPGLFGYLTERGTLFYSGRVSEDNFLSRFPFKGGVVLEADWNGKVLWEVRHPDHHHVGVAAQRKRSAELSGQGSRRNCPASQRWGRGPQSALSPLRSAAAGGRWRDVR